MIGFQERDWNPLTPLHRLLLWQLHTLSSSAIGEFIQPHQKHIVDFMTVTLKAGLLILEHFYKHPVYLKGYQAEAVRLASVVVKSLSFYITFASSHCMLF